MPAIRLSEAQCRALVISCSDFRFISAQRQARLVLGLENAYDLIARPGGVRQVVLPTSEAARQTMEEEIALLHKLHDFDRILLMNHMNCGMYQDLASAEDERRVHIEHLAEAKQLLEQRFPGLVIETYLSVVEDDTVKVVAMDPGSEARLQAARSE